MMSNRMTLTPKDINSTTSRSCNYHHFSKLSSSRGTDRSNIKHVQEFFLKHELKTTYQKPCKGYARYNGRDWVGALDKDENKLRGHFLSTDSDSVLEYSIASAKPHMDPDYFFAPPLIQANKSLELHELNAQLSLLLEEYSNDAANCVLLSKLAFYLIPQAVQLNQALSSLNHDANANASEISALSFVQLCSEIIQETWLPNLSKAIKQMRMTAQILKNYEGKYIRIVARDALENESRYIIRKWSLLNYFPKVIIRSLSFRIESSSDLSPLTADDRQAIARGELFKIMFVTLAIEASKGFEKMIKILMKLRICEQFKDSIVIDFLEILLDCTIESRVGEIMIGHDCLIKDWITMKSDFEPYCRLVFHQWGQEILINYRNQREQEKISAEDDEADLMFDNWEVGNLFVSEILYFIERGRTTRQDTLAWMTVFDEDYEAASYFEDEDDQSFAIDSITIASIPEPAQRSNYHGRKREALKRWAKKNRRRMSSGCNKIKRTIEQMFHVQTNHALITSVRYYKAVNGRRYEYHFQEETTGFTSAQCAQVQRLTQKLYKREQKGKRKRDALKVIFT